MHAAQWRSGAAIHTWVWSESRVPRCKCRAVVGLDVGPGRARRGFVWARAGVASALGEQSMAGRG